MFEIMRLFHTYDSKCLSNVLTTRSKLHQMSQSGSNICKPLQSVLGNNMCKYLFSIVEQENIDKSKYELKLEKGSEEEFSRYLWVLNMEIDDKNYVLQYYTMSKSWKNNKTVNNIYY